MTTRADLIIVGAGLAGAAAAYSAARRGAHVVVLEQFAPGHKNGSSHGSARIFRRAYPDPLYVRLAGQAGELWRSLEADAGEELLTLTGGVDFGRKRNPEPLRDAVTSGGAAAELMPGEAAQERWPLFDFTDIDQVMFHPDAGVLDPDRAVTAMLAQATARGADVRFHAQVTHLSQTEAGGARVSTADDTVTAPVAVIAAGAWTGPLLDGLVSLPPLTVTQQQVFHFAPVQETGETPIFIVQDETDHCYGLPGGRDGGVPGAVKVGEHDPGTVTSAVSRDFKVDPRARDRLIGFVQRRLPGLVAEPPVNELTCLYTWTKNEDFVLDRHGPFVIASPCSGHGAKFAPLLGEIIADLAAGQPSPEARFTLAAHLKG